MSQTQNATIAVVGIELARTLSASWAMMSEVPLCCVRNGRVADFCNSIPPGADIRRPLRHVRFVPISAASHPSSYSGCRI